MTFIAPFASAGLSSGLPSTSNTKGLGLVLAVPGPLAHKLVLVLLSPGDVQGRVAGQVVQE